MSPPGITRTLTSLPAVFRRHKTAPLFHEREAYLEYLRQNGMRYAGLKSTASTLVRVPQMLRMTTLRDVTHHEVERAAARWRKYPWRIGGGSPGPSSAPHFARVAKKWLTFHGKLLPRPPRFQPFSKELCGFSEYLRAERGYLSATAATYSNSTGRFLRWFSRRRRRFSLIRLTDIGRYFKYKDRMWNQVTLAGEARILRAFFRYAGERGLCPPHITYGIDSPPIRGNSLSVQPPPWRAVVKTIASTKGRNPAEIRARAILLLCATYGLRSGEIASLQLCNFDWENNIFTVNRSKRRGIQQFPISRTLRCALLRYLQKVRPNCYCGSLFVTFHPPFRSIAKESIYLIVRLRIDRIGVQCDHKGPHALRHACATRLLETGTSLRDIADFLGHRDCQSVRIYAKHDLNALRSVSVLDLCGSL
jgi:integrase/recombinase XerD